MVAKGALEAAAGNTGSAGSVIGAGIGLGIGVGMGQTMGGGIGQAAQQVNYGGQLACPACRVPNAADAAFCKSCGVSLRPAAPAQAVCRKCSKPTAPGAFCSNCGSPQESRCSGCSATIPAGAKFCPGCGKPA